MASVRFVLKQPKSISKTTVFCLFSFGAPRPLKISTGLSILAKQWNPKKQRAIENNTKFPNYISFNQILDSFETKAIDTLNRLKLENKLITHEILKRELSTLRGTVQDSVSTISFLDYIQKEFDNKKRKYFITLRNHLLTYAEKRKILINYDAITIDFYYDFFFNFLQNEKQLSRSTIGKFIQITKLTLRDAYEDGLHKNLIFQSRRFKSVSETTDKIYLTEDELDKLYKLNLNFTPRLERVRDLFLIGCYTGLRYSDFSTLSIDDFNFENNTLSVRTQKTGYTVVIPLHTVVLEIIKKYNNKLPKANSNQKTNAYLKEIGELAEINEKVVIKSTKGGEQVSKVFKKYELICTHTALRSAATNMFKSGIPTNQIMKITGHLTEKTFLRYLRIDAHENATILQSSTFFTQKNISDSEVLNFLLKKYNLKRESVIKMIEGVKKGTR